MRLIDADGVIKKITKLQDGGVDTYRHLTKVINIIIDAPTIEPERTKGKWILDDLYYPYEYRFCSECGAQVKRENAWDYCPNCGADMRGEQE